MNTISSQPALKADRLTVRFGGLTAVDSVSFSVDEGKIVSLIGPNGAGKTTIINAITGFVSPSDGEVRFHNRDICGWRPERLAEAGLVRTFQNAAMFKSASVVDNLATGYFVSSKAGLWQTLLRMPRFRNEERLLRERTDYLLDLLKLQHRRDVLAGSLPCGEQRVLGVGIALMTRPSLLLLDEPAAGLNSDEAKLMARLIRTINGQGTTILLIEHNMPLVMTVSSRVIVVKQGKLLADGTPDEIRKHPDVISAYLGEDV